MTGTLKLKLISINSMGNYIIEMVTVCFKIPKNTATINLPDAVTPFCVKLFEQIEKQLPESIKQITTRGGLITTCSYGPSVKKC